MTLAQVKTLSASYGRPEFAAERVPTLAELCAILPADVVLALELKTDRFLEPDVCRKLADELAAAGVLDRTVVLSFSLARVEAVAAAAPDMPKGFITMSKLTPKGVDAQLIGAFWPVYFLNPFYVRQAHAAGQITCPLDPTPERPAVVLPLAGVRCGAGERSRRDDPRIGAQAGMKLIVKGGSAIGRAKHKGGGSRQRKRQLEPPP